MHVRRSHAAAVPSRRVIAADPCARVPVAGPLRAAGGLGVSWQGNRTPGEHVLGPSAYGAGARPSAVSAASVRTRSSGVVLSESFLKSNAHPVVGPAATGCRELAPAARLRRAPYAPGRRPAPSGMLCVQARGSVLWPAIPCPVMLYHAVSLSWHWNVQCTCESSDIVGLSYRLNRSCMPELSGSATVRPSDAASSPALPRSRGGGNAGGGNGSGAVCRAVTRVIAS